MKKEEKKDRRPEKFDPPLEIPARPFRSNPETPLEIINTYGTYEVQATANSENDFPAIAQGIPIRAKKRDPRFFRGPDDFNPASDRSSDHSI